MPNIFWTCILTTSVITYVQEFKSTKKTLGPFFNLCKDYIINTKINVDEIKSRINMLITIYGAANIFQIMKIPE